MNARGEKILNISNFTNLPRSESDIILDCYIAFCTIYVVLFHSWGRKIKT